MPSLCLHFKEFKSKNAYEGYVHEKRVYDKAKVLHDKVLKWTCLNKNQDEIDEKNDEREKNRKNIPWAWQKLIFKKDILIVQIFLKKIRKIYTFLCKNFTEKNCCKNLVSAMEDIKYLRKRFVYKIYSVI